MKQASFAGLETRCISIGSRPSPLWVGCYSGLILRLLTAPSFFLKRQFHWTEVQTEIAASSLLFGCVLGASSAGAVSDRLGRRRVLAGAAALFALSSLITALPNRLEQFCAARVVAGIAIGAASMLSPLYIAEISPASIRGFLVGLNQFAIVTGILISYLVGWLLAGIGDQNWRWMFASAFAPSLLFLFALFFVPESPRWLAKENWDIEGLDVLRKIEEGEGAAARLAEIKAAIAQESGSLAELLKSDMRRPLLIGVSLAVL